MLSCGPGGNCCGHCRGGFGAAPVNLANHAPATTRVLYDYVIGKLQTGEPFFISEEINSDVMRMDGMGFLPAIFAAVSAIAPTITSVASVAGTVAAVKGAKKGKQLTAEEIAAAVTPAVKAQLAADGVNLPNDVAQKTVAASILDSFGEQNRPWVIAGLAGVGLLLLLKLTGR